MNSLYWAHVPSIHFTQYHCRKFLDDSPEEATQKCLKLTGPNAYRVNDSLSDYSKQLNDFANWTRLNALVSVVSYFETYISSVVSLAIESDLGLIYSVSKRIDGILILKNNGACEYSFFDKSEEITKGTWSQRIANYERIFGRIPPLLKSSCSDLEKIRKIRNNVAHAFGRDIQGSRDRCNMEILPIERLSEKRLQKYMKLIRDISKQIDNHLQEDHIGEYEIIHYLHTIFNELPEKSRTRELKRRINSLDTKQRSVSFCDQLLNYYLNI